MAASLPLYFKTKFIAQDFNALFARDFLYSKRHKNLSNNMPFTYYERTTIAQ